MEARKRSPKPRQRTADDDANRRAHIELRLAIEHAVMRVLEESSSIAEASQQVIRAICEALGWACGARWEPEKGTQAIHCAETWGVRSAGINAFLEATRRQAPSTQLGGLNRRTWAERRPIWVQDVTREATFRRAPEAAKAGLRSAFAFPIKVGADVIGVMEFFSHEIREPDSELLDCMTYVGSQIGQFLQRKQAEEALRRFRVAMDNSADMIVLIDRNTMRFVDVNNTACRLLGYTRDELLQMGPQDVLDASRAELERVYDEFIANPSQTHGMHSYYRTKNGSTFPFESTRHVLRSGESYIIAAISRDISARVAAEEGLLRFRAAMDTSADMIMLVDRATMRYVDVNATACEMQGYTREEMLQMGPQDVSPVSREVLERSYDESIASGETTRLQSHHRRKDGTQIPVEIVRRAVRTGERWIIVAIVRDISERKRDERLLTLEHAVNRNLAEADTAAGAIRAAIRAVCETQGWECGRYFRVDEKAGVLRFSDGWSVPGAGYEAFIEKSLDVTYTSGVGLIGLVWQSGQPVWSIDATKDARVAQPALARDAGSHGAFIFPVVAEGKVIGALVFSSRKVREPDERLLQAVRVIGSQIGQVLRRIEAQERMRESEERFRSLTKLSSDMYWEQDEQFRFTAMSGTGSRRVNLKTFPAIGKKRWEQNYVNMTADQWAQHIALLEAHQEFRDMELCRLDESGNKIWISISGAPVFDASGTFRGYRGVGKDITERKLDEERIQYLANHDALTDLPNRPRFTDTLSLALQNARRYKRNFAVLFIDLDRFKIINDTLGHEAGDKLLKEVGMRLTHTVRSSDVVARLGGDEFVVLVQEVDEAKQVEVVARKILTAVIKPVFIGGQECRVTASIGICMYPSEAQDEQALMKNADIAMYRAKEEGKNTFKFYSEESNVHSFERLALETSLRRGLERNEFFLHYQAKLDLHTRKITGVEALVRWRHPELGMVPPGQFIPLAEETGLIVPIGKWVLQTACHQNVAWLQQGLPPLRISVNLSARQFADENLLEDIVAALKASGMRAELLELELTESMVMQNAERAGKVLADIKQMGVRLAIDDFGVGYSSLTHLKRFPIDTLKVDRSFIRDIPQNSEDKAITEAIIAMGKSLNLTVVAEGVETLDQQTFLHEHNCDEMQGFFFSRPIPSDEFAELLRQRVKSS